MSIINGTGHADTLHDAETGDIIYGLQGNDAISTVFGNDSLFGGTGTDTITGSIGNNSISGGDGNDLLSGGSGANTILGGTGNDTIVGGTGSGDLIYGNTGDDSITVGAGHNIVYGNDGNDVIHATSGSDMLMGGKGMDTITAGSGANMVQGNTGNDLLIGSSGQDTMYGDAGNDTILGGTGASYLAGGTGSDSLVGGSGHDTLIGGDGSDNLSVTHGSNLLVGDSLTNSGHVNLVVNGSFEADQLASGSWGIYPTLTGWAAPAGQYIELQNFVTFPAAEGNQIVELDANPITATDLNSSMVQHVATNGTGPFTLSFEYTDRPSVPATSSGIEVFWNGQLLDTVDSGTPGWSTHTYTVTGAGATTDLEFVAVGTPDGVGGLLDNVQVWSGATSYNDTLVGGSGNDTLVGGQGNDELTAGSGFTLFKYTIGSDGSDVIHNFNPNDTLHLYAPNVYLGQTHIAADGHGNVIVSFDNTSDTIKLIGVSESVVQAHTLYN